MRYRAKTAALAIRTLRASSTSVACEPYGLWLMPVLRLSFLISKVEGNYTHPACLTGTKGSSYKCCPPFHMRGVGNTKGDAHLSAVLDGPELFPVWARAEERGVALGPCCWVTGW